MTTIRIDREVYSWIQSQATPFEDTPNSVLRRVAGLEVDSSNSKSGEEQATMNQDTVHLRGKALGKKWNVNAKHFLYHTDGKFYENLTRFPGALLDPNGFVIFHTQAEYLSSPYLNIGQKLNIRDRVHGIASIPGYKRMA